MENKINTFQKGLNRDSQYLNEGEYDTLINGNFDSYDTSFILTNEMSNLLSSQFKAGFEVLHATNDSLSNTTYFFLVNPTTGEGEFGQIKNLQTVSNLEDLPSECDDCGIVNDLATPLEDTVQVPINTYETLLSDACKANKKEGFNFSINKPIKFSVIKNEKCGKVIYFTDDYNAFRYIKIDKISQYFIENVPCADDTTVNCIDFEDLRVFKLHNFPIITPKEIQSGGRLEEGVYEFAIAYTDEEGSEITEYTSMTNPISIFDPNQVNKDSQVDGSQTNYAIRLDVQGLDLNFSHYKIIVAQTLTKNNGVTSYFEEGIHTTDNNIVVYSGSANKKESSLNRLTLKNAFLERVGMVSSSNNTLFVGGLTFEKEDNLQPVVNFLGEFMQWQTHVATEDLYQNGVNTSKFLGINRDEVVPYGIKFLYDGGYKSSIFPLIGRQAKPSDLTSLPLSNRDVKSINSFDDCTTTQRTKKWQFYNTATADQGFCGNEIETVEVFETSQKICFIEDIDESLNQTLTIQLDEPFTDLETYIEDNRDNELAFTGTNLFEKLNVANYPQTCGENLFKNCYEVCEGEDCYEVCEDTDCTTPELIDATIEVTTIEVVEEEYTEVDFPEEYSKLARPEYCNLYRRDGVTGEYEKNYTFEFLYMTNTLTDFYGAWFRDYGFINEKCNSADEIVEYTPSNSYYQGYFHNYLGALTVAELQSNKTTVADLTEPSAQFTNKVHKDALWYKGATQGRESFLLELTKLNWIGDKDDVITAFWNPQQKIRVSIFNKCGDTEAIYSNIFSVLNTGAQYKIEVGEDFITIDDGINTPQTISIVNPFPNGSFYVAVDTPIVECAGATSIEPRNETIITKYRTAPPDGCYGIVTRAVEYSQVTITWSKITTRKRSVYESTCTFQQPVVQDCTAIPYKKGDFAYWESNEQYPDNNELFNSKDIVVTREDIPTNYLNKFETKFVKSNIDGKYQWKTSLKKEGGNPEPIVDFTCRPIRHFKFPDNQISPFIYSNLQAPFSGSLIYPLGVTIPEDLINSFLDIAVKNKLISEERRNKIVGYEIVRGDLSTNRSVITSGLLYDYRKYKEKNKDIFYPNYPFNDLGSDKLNLDATGKPTAHPYAGVANDKFSFHSPESDYQKVPTTTEMSVQAYMFGNSRGHFDQVEGHSKWVVLSSKARDTANLLAGLETATEVAVNVAQSAEAWRFGGGLFFTANPVGIGLNIASAALSAVSSVVANFGRYRYEWLKAFRDLGQPQNFAYYYYGEGKYNYIKTLQEEGNKLRSLQVAKYIKEGNAVTTNRVTGEIVSINNLDRERGLFLGLGVDNKLNYPIQYSTYDNNKVDFNRSSLTFASESNLCEIGKSSELQKNVASPYVALKNYVPNQFGTINSINWISTGYQGDLKNPKLGCLSIFGGDTFISRHTLKRKIPLFVTDATNLPDLIPFNYKFYNNIGKKPRFYADYEVLTDYSRGSATLPDINYELAFDCSTRGGNYYKPPSKFYLYYYGVPSFLTETRINTNARTAGKEPKDDFYPNYGDLGKWTQEKQVSIRNANVFKYNPVYSKVGINLGNRTLPINYKKSEFNCRADAENGVMYSLPDNTENNYTDPWTIFRPGNRYEFPTSWGRLVSIKGIENEKVLVRLTDSTAIFNSVDVTIDNGTPAEVQNLGQNGVFTRRPTTFQATELGHGGTQSHQTISTEFGHFHVDAKRGQVLQVLGGKGGMQEISSFIDGKPSGMRNWFKEQLPFKILNKFPNVDVDNPYNGMGISMGYDSRFKRLFITKKDFIPIGDCLEEIDGQIYQNLTECGEENPTYTCPIGFTYEPIDNICRKETITDLCTVGYTYNSTLQLCEKQDLDCEADIVIVMDNSGSVNPTEMTQMNQFVLDLVSEVNSEILSGSIKISIVKFGSAAEIKTSLSSDITTINTAINSTMPTNGTTNVNDGLCKAESVLVGVGSRLSSTKKIILVVDGYQNSDQSTPCGTPNTVQGSLTFAQQLKDAGVEITLVILGNEPERNAVKNQYGGASSGVGYTNYPLPSIGTGLYGRATYEASFDTVSTIVEDIKNQIICFDYVPTLPCNTPNIENGTCVEVEEVSPTIVYEPIQIPTCSQGYTYNSITEMCERTIVQDLCPIGYVYNELDDTCEKTYPDCIDGLDIVFVIDSTTSQVDAINNIKSAISSGIVPAITTKFGTDYRMGLISVEGKQDTDRKLFKVLEEMTLNNSVTFTSKLNTIVPTPSGGNIGIAEPTDLALQAVLNNTPDLNSLGEIVGTLTTGEFRTGVNRVIILTTDATPSGLDDDYTFDDWVNAESISEQALSDGVRIYTYNTATTEVGTFPPVFPTTAPSMTYIMKNYANVSGGKYRFNSNGSGIGEAIIEDIVDSIGCKDVVPSLVCELPDVLDPKSAICTGIESVTPTYIDNVVVADLSNPLLFKDVSWTIAFSLVERKWIGWYDYKPNYYIAHQNYFQTGLRGKGLWSHLLTNKSYQVFYGELKPFEIIYKSQFGLQNSTLKNIKIEADVLRYHNLYDYAVIDDKFFTKATIFTSGMNTGVLNLHKNTGQMNLISKYPITAPDGTSQSILYSKTDNKYNLNYFYNRSLRSGANNPNMLYDDSAIRRRVNTNFVKFGGKKTLEFIRGGFYYIQLKQDAESRLRFNLNIGIIQEDKI